MWTYQGKTFTSEDIADNLGFVYVLTNLFSGKMYVGQKKFVRRVKQANGRRKKTESDWQKYWGSNKVLHEELKDIGKENFSREILHLCKTKGEMNYKELVEQVTRSVLLSPQYYNDFVGGKIHRKHLKALQLS